MISLLAFLAYRCLRFLLLLVVTSAGIFLILEILPGDPAIVMLGTSADPETLAALRAELGLDKPLIYRLGDWLINLASGNLGMSQSYGVSVVQLISERLEVSLPLMLGVALLSQAAGLMIGIARAYMRSRYVKSLLSMMITLALATPPFWLAMMLIGIFTLWLGGGTMRFLGWQVQEGMTALILPMLTLVPAQAAIIARVVCVSLEDALRQPYIVTALAKGCRSWCLIWHHALPHTALPLITLAGLQTAYLFAGSVAIETVFSLPGLGHLLVQAAERQDLVVVRSLILLCVAATLLINHIADGLCRIIDSRVGRFSPYHASSIQTL